MLHRCFLPVCFFAAIGSCLAQTVPSSGLVGYWNANGNANDSSTVANHGSYSGSFVTGVSGNAFNLATGYVTIADSPSYTFSDMSVGLWFNSTGTGYTGAIVAQDTGAGAQLKWFVGFRQLSTGVEVHLNNTSAITNVSSPNPLAVDTAWHHLAVVKSGANYSFYYDGLLEGTVAAGTSAFIDPSVALKFGFAEAGYNFNGYLDEVVLYDRPLTAGEVAGLAAIPEPGSTAFLFGAAVALAAFRRRSGKVAPGRK